MSFVEMTNEEWEAVRKHHDALVHMAELELKADEIRANCSDASAQQMLGPIELQMHELDNMIAALPG